MLKFKFRGLTGALCALLLGSLGWSNSAQAQLPTSVDIGIYETVPGTLEVRMRPNGQPFDELVSGVVFTIKWEIASGASLGMINQQIGAVPGVAWCPLLTVPLAANPVLTDGGFNYATWTSTSTTQLQSCAFSPGYSWPADTEVVLAEIPYSGATGCVNFELTSDAYITSQNGEYFVSLNGTDLTGGFSNSTVSVGCAADCIRITSVDPVTGDIVIQNLGSSAVDVSGYRLCALFNYTADLTSVLSSGTLSPLAVGATATLNWSLNSTASDLGLYLPTGAFGDENAMMDFTQWGSGGNGRESVAVTKGIWSAGDYVDQTTPWNPPFTYTGADCTENGVSFWTGADCLGAQGGTALPGSSCDDGDPTTGNDVYQADCSCAGQLIDCEGVPGGTDLPGASCDDGDPTTGNDVYQADCTCAGQLIDCEGVPGGTDLPGASCDDGDPTTGNDVYQADCTCAGQLIDCEGVPGGTDLPGAPCDDGDPTTGNDVYQADCTCAGDLIDCEGVPGGTDLPGASCDDGDPTTGNDVYQADCTCAGQLIDCEGVPGGTDLPGAPCDDGDPTTGNDVYQADCTCAGDLIDCLGVPGGAALPGTPCDDGDPNTGGDVYQADCTCAGSAVDCNGVPGGPDVPGAPCDDGDPTTGNDVYQADCTCAGQLIDCEGVPGGTDLPGAPCDDGDPTTGNDVYQADCTCAGDLIDCEGVPGGTDLPGAPCDDGDPTTGNDVYQADCTCSGDLIDCLGVPGGTALPGTPCDDGDPNTGGDVYQADCTCAGSAVDCNGVPGGPDVPGAPCDDGDPTTGNDVYQADCTCSGDLIDCLGVPGGTALPSTPCDDGDPNTGGDVYQADCTCAGSAVDCNGVPGGPDVPGAPCDDGDPTTGNDVYQADCTCAGQLIDCEGVPGGTDLPGASCDDGDPTTGNDVYQADCTCAGQLIDCEGVPGGTDLPGAPCDDGDPTTGNDVYQADCTCSGDLIDCLGVPGGTALPGTPCDDGDPNTGGDVYQADCTCAGSAVDCNGVPGGPDVPGAPCDDGDPTTGNDVYQADCTCAGQLIDCLGVPGGTALPGTPCDDGDPNTGGDVYQADCTCAGSIVDCNGVPGGPDVPGAPCDDGDPTTGNDVYQADCTCSGDLIDCLGVPGGTALPGTPCDDGDPNTVGDAYQADCTCAGATSCPGEELTLQIQTDNNGNETTWAIFPAGSGTAVCTGGPYASNTFLTEVCCVPFGCYRLEVYDSMGDGMFAGLPGGYALLGEPVLPNIGGSRIIDNTADGQFGSISTLINNNSFCVPLSNDAIKPQSCDKMDYDVNDFIEATNNPFVAAEFGGPNAANSGYQYWIFDPDGTYSRFIFVSHANPSPGAPPGAYAVNHLRISSMATLPVPQLIQLNVRVRGRVNGVYNEFGPACVMMVDPVAANDPCKLTKLVDDPTSQYFSCGVQREWGMGQFVVAKPVVGANRYQFYYTDNNGYNRFIAYPSYFSYLSWGTLPLVAGNTYDVSVRASFDNGATYCSFGEVCQVEIVASSPFTATSRDAVTGPAIDFQVYPNPNRGEALFITLEGISDEIQNVDIDITDLFGKRIHAEQIAVSGETFNYALNLDESLAQGMYLVNLRVEDKVYVQRIVRQ